MNKNFEIQSNLLISASLTLLGWKLILINYNIRMQPESSNILYNLTLDILIINTE